MYLGHNIRNVADIQIDSVTEKILHLMNVIKVINKKCFF